MINLQRIDNSNTDHFLHPVCENIKTFKDEDFFKFKINYFNVLKLMYICIRYFKSANRLD